MKNLLKTSVMLAVFAIAIAFNPAPAQAQDTFDLTVKHNINGRSLGLSKDLPVEVFVNHGEEAAFSFSFGETFVTPLPAGDYYIEVYLVETDEKVMDLQTGEVPAGIDVTFKAQLSGEKTPALKVRVNK